MHYLMPLFSKLRSLHHAPFMRSNHVLFLLTAVSNIVSECVTIMHAKASLCQNDLCSSKSFQVPRQNARFRVLFFSAVQNRFKYHLLSLISIFFTAVPYRIRCRKNAPFSVLVCKIVSAVRNRFKCCQNAPFTFLFSKFSLKFKIVSNNSVNAAEQHR